MCERSWWILHWIWNSAGNTKLELQWHWLASKGTPEKCNLLDMFIYFVRKHIGIIASFIVSTLLLSKLCAMPAASVVLNATRKNRFKRACYPIRCVCFNLHKERIILPLIHIHSLCCWLWTSDWEQTKEEESRMRLN